MKRLVLGVFALAVTLAGPALAQPVNWTGGYLGGGFGGIRGQVDRFYPNFDLVHLPLLTFTTRGDDGIGSAHAGLQWQFGQWVIGAEATYARPIDQAEARVSLSPPEPFSQISAYNLIRQLITIGPRVGFAFDRFLVYGTGGYAVGKIKGGYLCSDGTPLFPGRGTCSGIFGFLSVLDFTGTTWNNGWFVGGGIDYMLFQRGSVNVVLGLEYQHFDLGQKLAFCFSANCARVSMQDHVNFHHGASGDIVRARLTFQSNGFYRN